MTTETVGNETFATAKQATEQVREFGEQATEQVRELGERATDSGRAFGKLALDTYEQAVNTFVDFEHKAAEAAPVDWAKAAIEAHASFVGEINEAYLRAARAVLSTN